MKQRRILNPVCCDVLLIRKYIGRNATHEVNLSYELVKSLHRMFVGKSNGKSRKTANATAGVAGTAAGAAPTPVSTGGGGGGGLEALAAAARALPARSAAAAAVSPTAHAGATHRTVAADQKSPAAIAATVPSSGATTHRTIPIASSSSDQGAIAAGDNRSAAFFMSVFDAAYDEIHKLLESDSFPRFVQSALFDELVRYVSLITIGLSFACCSPVTDSFVPCCVSFIPVNETQNPVGM